ncbi:MAG: hypothetical protein ACTHL8_13835 [Burkholderiaceae bacterium]
MADYDFLTLAYDQLDKLCILALVASVVLFLVSGTRLQSLLTDPFHFYYTFTFGTSYGVVLLLWLNGLISPFAAYIVFGYGFAFIATYRAARASRINILPPLVRAIAPAPRNERRMAALCIAIFLLIAGAFISQVGFGFLQESRFEAARGFGSLSRALDALRLYLIAYLAIAIARRAKERRSWAPLLALTALLGLLGALVNGAKFALLETVYAAMLGIASSSVPFRLSLATKVLLSSLAAILTVLFAFMILTLNVSASGTDLSTSGQYLSDSSIVTELAANRVMGNADMYYLALPHDVIKRIDTANPLLLMLAPILGSGTVSSIVGFDVSNHEVGRAIWLYWYPGDPILRGPTNHFDMTAYRYFGVIGGTIFCVWLGFLLAQFSKLRQPGRWSDGQAALVAAFWLASLIMLMHPSIGFARLLDLVVVLGCIKMASLRWRAAPAAAAPIGNY